MGSDSWKIRENEYERGEEGQEEKVMRFTGDGGKSHHGGVQTGGGPAVTEAFGLFIGPRTLRRL